MVAAYRQRRAHTQLEREVDQAVHRAEANCRALEIRLDEFDARLAATRRSLSAAGYLVGAAPRLVSQPRSETPAALPRRWTKQLVAQRAANP